MRRTTYTWNATVIATLLTVALIAAWGCPANSPQNASRPASRPTESRAVPATDAAHEAAAVDEPDGTPVDSDPLPDATHVPPPEEETLFGDWPKPEFVLLVTGRQHGYIEPCGCAGLTNQKGGLARRNTLYEQLQDKGWEVVPLDAGNQVRRYGRQAEIKFQVTAEGLKKMDYQAVALGPDDLRLSAGELMASVIDSGEYVSPFLCANASLYELTKTHRIIEAAGKKIGVTGILGSERLKKLQSDEVVKMSPEEGLSQVAPELEAAGCDLQVLLAHADLDEARSLTEKFPQFDVVVVAVGLGDPPTRPEQIGKTQFIVVGEKSMHAGLLGVYDDPENRYRYQLVPLDKRFEDSDFMLKLLAAYQDTLQSEGLEGLGLRPIQHPSGYEFVGSSTCGECHTQAYEIWQTTPHHHATDAIVHPGERIEIPRHHDPECLSCHVTGWDPQGYFPYKSGYLDLEDSAHLHGNGCENCHGPGSRHVAAEMGELDLDDEAIAALRREMRLPLAEAEKKCLECHDLDNDPNFQKEGAFSEYWEQIKHYGKY
ncbi:MAG: hypothetical protein KY475_21280 [Planctomycetes bacterium]|nr:hypothetical protein [Planctomycetota bacterium]